MNWQDKKYVPRWLIAASAFFVVLLVPNVIKTNFFTDMGKPNILFLALALTTLWLIIQIGLAIAEYHKYKKSIRTTYKNMQFVFTDGKQIQSKTIICAVIFPIERMVFFSRNAEEERELTKLIQRRESLGSNMNNSTINYRYGVALNSNAQTATKAASVASGLATAVMLGKYLKEAKRTIPYANIIDIKGLQKILEEILPNKRTLGRTIVYVNKPLEQESIEETKS